MPSIQFIAADTAQRGAAGQDGALLPFSLLPMALGTAALPPAMPLIPASGMSRERALLSGHHVQLEQTTAQDLCE